MTTPRIPQNRFQSEPVTIRVLIIEDNPGDVRLLKETLKSGEFYRYEFVHRENLKDGIEYLTKGQTDVVLLDLSLPDSQGFDTFRRVNTTFTDVSVIVLTGVDDQELALRAMQEGAQDYLVKGEINEKLFTRSIRYSYERMQAKKALTKAYALKNIQQLAAAVCHEFSQPLQTLSGCLSLLEKESDKKYIEISQKMIFKITELLARLRDITDIKKQKYLSSQILDLRASSNSTSTEKKKRILIVDDELSVLELLVQGLRMAGYDVDGAKDGLEALDLVNSQNYNLIISDVNMPRIPGTTLFNMIRAINYPSLFVFLTGYSVSDDIEGTINKADGVLHKPVNFDYLFEFIDNLFKSDRSVLKNLTV